MIIESTNSDSKRIVGGLIAKQGQSLFFKAALHTGFFDHQNLANCYNNWLKEFRIYTILTYN